MTIEKIDTIGIALTSYNPNKELLHRQLKSIVEQSYSNWICCITIDNDELATFEDQDILDIISDKRFNIYYNNERLGFLKNFETAIGKCLTFDIDAIIMADHDDEWTLDRLSILRDKLTGQPRYSLVHSDLWIRKIYEDREEILDTTLWKQENRNVYSRKPHEILLRNIVGGATALIDVDLFKKYPNIPEGIEFHDHWYAVLASLHGKITHVDKPLYYYSVHSRNVAGAGEYVGLFSLKSHQKNISLIRLLIAKWKYVNNFYNVLEEHEVPLSLKMRLIFKSKFDFGFTNFIFCLPSLLSDRALFRSSISVTLGKVLSIFR